ncbi:MerR family transcriptional regulator [Priestia aryabhattai]|uniref:MerR family transcriptional regulator n=1 Tax=Priestia aryabhattai TaxID=412384 RepID=UPI002E1B9512|nr:MerR family transcriptional regulator [Priestia aryabhattai]MED4023659.1 MerR family transcriptional regulator [Priestia aryabhattai]
MEDKTAMNTYLKVEDVANLLEVTPSTISKYYLLFEKNNYRFKRSNKGSLMFSDNDVELFRKLIELKNSPGLTVEKAVVQLLEENIAITTQVIKKVEVELREKFLQLEQEMNERFKLINQQLDRIEGLTSKVEKSTTSSKEDREFLIERFKKGTLTADDVLYIMDNLENGERLDLLSKLYDLHYNFNPNHPNISEIEWED